jgi:O-methyltransferase involved in polyketide biosynthesis
MIKSEINLNEGANSMINLRLDGAVRTLILTLRARADEQLETAPLLDDPWSADWYQFMPEVKPLDDWYNPTFQLATVIRSRLIDDAVSAFIDSHDQPLIVELGAGFSTRYFRIGQDKTQWIELDLGDAIVARRKIDSDVDAHWFIDSDMSNTDWLNLLPDVDPKNTLFIAEGALMFLEEDNVKHLLDTLSEQYAGASFIFDVVNPDYIEHANGDFSQINAPMHWGIYEDELSDYSVTVNHISYLLLEHPERWDALNIDAEKRTKKRSGYIVSATLG